MELWDLYTKDREKTNHTMLKGETQPNNTYRMVVHVCVFNTNGEMIIQQRQPFKKGWSNMWDISVGGSAIAGDTSQMAAARELREELGIEMSFEDIRPSLTINFDKGFDDIYLVEKNIEIAELNLQYEEVKTVKWASMKKIIQMIDNGLFIPYHKALIELLFSVRNHYGAHTRQDIIKTFYGG